MDLITTHTNADFDALGSLVAAKKLYPNSRLLLPGSQEDAVREFLALAKEEIAVETEKECRTDDIDRLIIVDTKQISRIGIAAELIARGVEVHVYDHHPSMQGDVRADKNVYQEVGATVTMLAEIISKKKIRLSYIEATIMLIGIYEETGSLTYRSTTKLDVDMVSFLLSQGASLAAVSRYLSRELDESELSLLTRLINTTEKVAVKGVNVSFIELEESTYVASLGSIINKLMDIENIPVLFVFIRNPKGRVDVVARSTVSILDVNKVLSNFGGGGHPGAAGAKIHDMSLDEIKAKLIKVLKSEIRVTVYAKDIMSAEFKTLDADDTIRKARDILLKARLGGMAVVERGSLAGILTLVEINKAFKRGFSHSKVKGYMIRNVITVSPDAPLYAVHKIITEKDVGVIPVVDDSRILGVITRTDVLKMVHDSMFVRPQRVEKREVINLANSMAKILSRTIVDMMKRIGRLSDSLGYPAFAVGGLVRDLLLGGGNLDLDLVVEGDAIKLGHVLAEDLKASIVVHKKFGTCSVITQDKFKIDIATARKEIYEKPAALPRVEFSSLKDDLVRRDFTINAMAVSISPSSFGQLIDFFNGRRDLERGRIRVLHDGSFIDDPTRIFRAVRFEARFGFVMSRATEELIKNAIDKSMFDKVEPQRIRDELMLILKEKEPLRSLKRMAELDELRFIHPSLKLDTDIVRLYNSIDEVCAEYEKASYRKRSVERWIMYMMALFEDLTHAQVSVICRRFVFKNSDSIRVLSYKREADRITKILEFRHEMAPSKVYRVLEPLSLEVTLLLMARTVLLPSGKRVDLMRSRIRSFLSEYNGARLSVRGEDLKKMGLKSGPAFKAILDSVLYDKIDGKLSPGKGELERARKLVERLKMKEKTIR